MKTVWLDDVKRDSRARRQWGTREIVRFDENMGWVIPLTLFLWRSRRIGTSRTFPYLVRERERFISRLDERILIAWFRRDLSFAVL